MRHRSALRSGKSATSGLRIPANHTSAHDQFLSWCDSAGVILPALKFHQWVRTNAPHKSLSNKSLSVRLKDDCIHVKNWATDESITFFDDPQAPRPRQYDRTGRQCLDRLADEQQQTRYSQAAYRAEQLWNEGAQVPVSGYFIIKGLLDTHGARWHERLGCWLVLVTDINGTIYSVQRIYNNGDKRFLPGGKTTGGMFTIGSFGDAVKVLVCEGFATGCTLREATGATIVVAFNTGNLSNVCKAIRTMYPAVDMLVCADDDRQTEGNPGRSKAQDAARATGARVVYPPLCADCTCTDFNDAARCKRLAQ